MWATMTDTRLEDAHRLMDQLAVLCGLTETPVGSRQALRDARTMLKELLRLATTGGKYNGREVHVKVHHLTELQKAEEQQGARASLRRTAKALANVADLIDEANKLAGRAG